MVKRLSLLTGLLVASVSWACPASASTEVYTISGTGSGSLNGTAFSNSAFTFTLTGDTATLQNQGLTTQIDPLSTATATIDGFGPVTFSTATRLGQNNSTIFFGNSAALDLFDFLLGSPVDLASSFGPVTGTDIFALNQFVNVLTTGGNLSFTQSSSVQFSGVTGSDVSGVPEPSAWAMMLLGFGGIGLAMRRRNSAIPQLA